MSGLRNEYAAILDLERTPKNVLAAVAVSFIIRLEGCLPDDGPIIRDEFVKEWRALYAARHHSPEATGGGQ